MSDGQWELVLHHGSLENGDDVRILLQRKVRPKMEATAVPTLELLEHPQAMPFANRLHALSGQVAAPANVPPPQAPMMDYALPSPCQYDAELFDVNLDIGCQNVNEDIEGPDAIDG